MFSLICARINGWVNNHETPFETPSCSLWRHCNDDENTKEQWNIRNQTKCGPSQREISKITGVSQKGDQPSTEIGPPTRNHQHWSHLTDICYRIEGQPLPLWSWSLYLHGKLHMRTVMIVEVLMPVLCPNKLQGRWWLTLNVRGPS